MGGIASQELARLETHMWDTWDNYTLLSFRCKALQAIQSMQVCCQQPVPEVFQFPHADRGEYKVCNFEEYKYLAWLVKEADKAQLELEQIMTHTMELLVNSVRTQDLQEEISAQKAKDFKTQSVCLDSCSLSSEALNSRGVSSESLTKSCEALRQFFCNFNTMVHRSASAQRPSWKMGPRKTKERVLAKATSDYSKLSAPAAAHVLDLVRCTAYFDDPLTLALCFSVLAALTDIVRVKNRFTAPAPHGYRDVMINVRLSNGVIAEVQMGFDSLMILKEWMHPNYEIVRTTTTEELIQVCRKRALESQSVRYNQTSFLVEESSPMVETNAGLNHNGMAAQTATDATSLQQQVMTHVREDAEVVKAVEQHTLSLSPIAEAVARAVEAVESDDYVQSVHI